MAPLSRHVLVTCLAIGNLLEGSFAHLRGRAVLGIDEEGDFFRLSQGENASSDEQDQLQGKNKTKFRQTMQNHKESIYTVDFVLGGQKIRGVMDSGSFDLVVFSKDCGSCGLPLEMYDQLASKTFKMGTILETQSYGSGDLHTVSATEEVSFGGKLKVAEQPMWLVNFAEMQVLQASSFDAIVGVGPVGKGPKDPSDEYVALVNKQLTTELTAGGYEMTDEMTENIGAYSQRLVDKQQREGQLSMLVQSLGMERFSVCLGKANGSDGYFIWNDDAVVTHPDKFVTVPVAGENTWSTHFSKPALVYTDDKDKMTRHEMAGCEGKGCAAILDTGTSLIMMPTKSIKSMASILRKYSVGDDCENAHLLPNFEFNLEGQTFTLGPSAYLQMVKGAIPDALKPFVGFKSKLFDGACRLQLAVMKGDENTNMGSLFIVGLPFFRDYYTTFQMGSEEGQERSFYMAHADDNCEPAADKKPASLLGSKQREFRTIDASTLRVPSFAQAVAPTKRRPMGAANKMKQRPTFPQRQ